MKNPGSGYCAVKRDRQRSQWNFKIKIQLMWKSRRSARSHVRCFSRQFFEQFGPVWIAMVRLNQPGCGQLQMATFDGWEKAMTSLPNNCAILDG